MQIVFFAHPQFTNSVSMNKYATMLAEGMREKGHNVQIWYPESYFSSLVKNETLVKWFGYIDQFFIFPFVVKLRMKQFSKDTLYVLTDHALGPWMPLIKDNYHIVHCHDFLAQQSALDKIKENRVGFTGKIYQKYIYKGYSLGRNFISISYKTQSDLHALLPNNPSFSEVVYNWVDPIFVAKDQKLSRKILSENLGVDLSLGFILHIGGNQFYKNRTGVIEAYNYWRNNTSTSLPLLMVGKKPNELLYQLFERSRYQEDIHFLTDIKDSELSYIYSGASVLFFPSLAEGFGWPIVEAMKCGCPVITTNENPMAEVAGDAACFIPHPNSKNENWAEIGATAIEKITKLSEFELENIKMRGFQNVMKFNYKNTFDKIENIYSKITEL